MAEAGAIVYRGPSMLTGDPIVAVLTGLDGGSRNPKTGPMVQAWVIRSDVSPMDAKRQNVDDARDEGESRRGARAPRTEDAGGSSGVSHVRVALMALTFTVYGVAQPKGSARALITAGGGQ